MSQSCNHDCSNCHADCDSRQGIAKEQLNEHSRVRKVIGVVSGKGGVGKSSVSSMLAIAMNQLGYHVGVLDADITGPSIARIFGCSDPASGQNQLIFPNTSSTGIDVVSVNMMLDSEDTPVLWRGPVVAGIVKQFYRDVFWNNIDFLFVDMPPGTGDVALTVFQSLPVDGVIIVTTPQDLVSMIVGKAVNMAKMMNVPILGLVENMSYYECPDCGKKVNIFGDSHLDEVAAHYGLAALDRLPIRPEVAKACDEGILEYTNVSLPLCESMLSAMLERQPVRIAVPTTAEHTVNQHYGKSDLFTFYDINTDGDIQQVIEGKPSSAGHDGLANYLAAQNVAIVLAGHMGEPAYEALRARGMHVVRGVDMDVDVAVKEYLEGNLVDDQNSHCDDHHEEGGSCCCH